MTRRISTLLMLTIFALSLLSVPTFAAKAKVGSNMAVNEVATAQAAKPAPVGGADDPYAYGGVGEGRPNSSVTSSLGFQAANGIVDLGVTTRYDLPGNQSQMRQIAIGCSGNVHAVWADLQPAATRFIAAASYIPGGAIATGTGSTPGGGFPDLGVAGDGRGFGVWHVVASGGTLAGIDFSCAAAAYASSTVYPDSSPIVTASSETSNYIWPRIAVDREADGDWFAHVVSHESPIVAASDLTGYQSLIYNRSQANSHQPVAAATGAFIDSVSGITATVIAHPDQADQRVAIVYTRPRHWVSAPDTSGINDNVVYRESTNLGVTWGPITTIYNFANTPDPMFNLGFERGYETSGLYAADGCLHVLFQSRWASDTLGNSVYYFPGRIRHWDKCSNISSIVTEGSDATASCLAQSGTVTKVTLSECQGKLYAIFSKQLNVTDANNVEVYRDCSTGGYANYDLFAKASSTAGLTWGPDSNLTNTRAAGPSYNCAAGACRSEINLGSIEHVTDSLRILYLEDRDAGINVQTQGAATDNPIKSMSLGCFNMVTFQSLSAAPSEVRYPFHTAPAGIKDTAVLLTNLGNIPSPHTSAISYISGSGWLAFGGTQGPVPAGTVPVGSPNTENIGLRATGPGAQGLYQATVTFTYDSGTKVINVPVDLYNFTNFYLPVDQAIRTSCNRMNVNQASEIANNVDGSRFSYFSDATDYLYDGFLILGNSATNLSYSTFGGAGSAGLPTVSNPYGFLYAAGPTTTYDSTTFANYRYASGQGYNRDSTIQFRSDYYAPKNPGTCNFYALVFTLKKGPNGPAGTINNLTVGYYADWDIPADTGSDNRGGGDATRSMVFQAGSDFESPLNNEIRYGALGGVRDDGNPVVGGFVVSNPIYIYPEVGWENDSLWNKMEALTVGSFTAAAAHQWPSGAVEDLSMTLVLARDQVINGATSDSLKFAVIVAGVQAGVASNTTALNTVVDGGYDFLCDNNLITCANCLCGDANNSGGFSISDAVFIIAHIFGGGPAPAQPCLGDANGSGGISISDAVYLIAHIFGGGPAPFCP